MDLLAIYKAFEDVGWCSREDAVSVLYGLVTPEKAMDCFRKRFASKAKYADLRSEDQLSLGRVTLAKAKLAEMLKSGKFDARTTQEGEEVNLLPLQTKKGSTTYGLSNIFIRLFMYDKKWHTLEDVSKGVMRYADRKKLAEWYLRRHKKPKDSAVSEEALCSAAGQYITVRPFSEFRRSGELDEKEENGTKYFRLRTVKTAGRR